jgi:hypothetical protein
VQGPAGLCEVAVEYMNPDRQERLNGGRSAALAGAWSLRLATASLTAYSATTLEIGKPSR